MTESSGVILWRPWLLFRSTARCSYDLDGHTPSRSYVMRLACCCGTAARGIRERGPSLRHRRTDRRGCRLHVVSAEPERAAERNHQSRQSCGNARASGVTPPGGYPPAQDQKKLSGIAFIRHERGIHAPCLVV